MVCQYLLYKLSLMENLDILQMILSFFSENDLKRLRKVCKSFNQAIIRLTTSTMTIEEAISQKRYMTAIRSLIDYRNGKLPDYHVDLENIIFKVTNGQAFPHYGILGYILSNFSNNNYITPSSLFHTFPPSYIKTYDRAMMVVKIRSQGHHVMASLDAAAKVNCLELARSRINCNGPSVILTDVIKTLGYVVSHKNAEMLRIVIYEYENLDTHRHAELRINLSTEVFSGIVDLCVGSAIRLVKYLTAQAAYNIHCKICNNPDNRSISQDLRSALEHKARSYKRI